MLSSDEKYRLIQAHKDEPLLVAAVVLKCAACLLVIAGIAAIGVMSDAEQQGDAGRKLAQHRERASVVHAREVLEERRARFEPAQVQRREMAGAAFSSGVARAATQEPAGDEVTLLRHASD